MSYKLKPLADRVTLVELTKEEIQQLTARALTNLESQKLDVLQYGRIIDRCHLNDGLDVMRIGGIVLFEKLAAHKTNFGTPRQLIVPIENIHGELIEETGDAN